MKASCGLQCVCYEVSFLVSGRLEGVSVMPFWLALIYLHNANSKLACSVPTAACCSRD